MALIRLLVAAGAVCAALAIPGPWPISAQAETDAQTAPPSAADEEARTRYGRGLALYRDGRLEPALVEFQRAYDLTKKHYILRSIGMTHIGLGHYLRAEAALRRYLATGGDAITVELQQQTRSHLRRLRTLIGELDVAAEPSGASVHVDGTFVGKAPLRRAIRVNAGERRISVRLDDHETQTHTISIAGGELQKVQFMLNPVQPAALPISARADEGVPWGTIGWVTTGVLAGTAAVTGAMTLAASDELSRDRAGKATPGGELRDQADRTKTFALTTDILIGAAAVAGGLTLWQAFADEDSGESPGVAMDVKLQPGGLDMSGRF